jgi:16S rRNA (guanine966-N2)-methyltransferase
MRVIAGTARGRRLVAPTGSSTRPTSDRVREATFNALGSLGVVVDATVLDLFAGSGAMGIEALSRGAAHATFVDQDRAARAAIEATWRPAG